MLTQFAVLKAAPRDKPHKLSDGQGRIFSLRRPAANSGASAISSIAKEQMLSFGRSPKYLAAADTSHHDAGRRGQHNLQRCPRFYGA